MKALRPRLSYANVISTLALVLALSGGAAYAAIELEKNTVGSKQLKKNSVTTAKIKGDAVNGSKVKAGSLTGTDLDVSTLGKVPSAASADRAVDANHATSADRAVSADRAASASTVTAGAVTPAGLSQVPAARVFSNIDQPLSDGITSIVTFNTESFDFGGLHNTTQTWKLTAPIAGVYRVSTSVGFEPKNGIYTLVLIKNGSIVAWDKKAGTTSAGNIFLDITDLVELKAGDWVRVDALQATGVTSDAVACTPIGSCPTFSMEWVAPA
jgi:hypothetical protein